MNIHEVKSINYKEKVAQLVPVGTENSNPKIRKVAFERIVRHIPTNKYGNVNTVGLIQQSTSTDLEKKKKLETEYLISTEEIYETAELQTKLNDIIMKIFTKTNEDTLYDGEITESTVGQKVPEIPTIDLDKTDQLNESTDILNDTKNMTINPTTFNPNDTNESNDSHYISAEQLNFTRNLNQNNLETEESLALTSLDSWELAEFGQNDIEDDFNTARTFEEDYEMINSTAQDDAMVPNLDINERPIRNRKQTDFFQSS